MKLSNKQHKDKEKMDLEYDAEIIRYKQRQKVYLEVIDNQNKRITNLEQQIIEKLKEIDELKRVLQLDLIDVGEEIMSEKNTYIPIKKTTKLLIVEDGSIDLENCEQDLLDMGIKCIVYGRGSQPPRLYDLGE